MTGLLVAAAVLCAACALRALRRPARARADWPRRARRRSARTRPVDAVEWAALLDIAASELRSGSTLSVAWSTATSRHGAAVTPDPTDPDAAVVTTVLGAAAALGGPMAASLDAGAALLRERVHLRAEAGAHAAQAKLSARVLTAVPLAFAAWSALTSATFRAAVTAGPGPVCLLTGCVLNLVGWRWMRRLVTRATG